MQIYVNKLSSRKPGMVRDRNTIELLSVARRVRAVGTNARAPASSWACAPFAAFSLSVWQE